MRITIYIHRDDLENLQTALNRSGVVVLDPVRMLNKQSENFVEVSLTYNEYTRCNDLEIFEELLSL
jgi:hypothetical protein|tara:strand:- start:2091 stop:2288 length:198 start_codon:yes stop_codon:yes gene_type:complete